MQCILSNPCNATIHNDHTHHMSDRVRRHTGCLYMCNCVSRPRCDVTCNLQWAPSMCAHTSCCVASYVPQHACHARALSAIFIFPFAQYPLSSRLIQLVAQHSTASLFLPMDLNFVYQLPALTWPRIRRRTFTPRQASVWCILVTRISERFRRAVEY